MSRKRNIKKTEPAAAQVPIIQQITVQPWNRQRQDITNWRNATRSAESHIPRRTVLYDLYHDVSTTDAQIIAVWSKRQDAITTANWEFTDKDGNPVDEINEMIDCIGFENLLKQIIDSKAWGYSMCEAQFFVNDNDQNEFIVKAIPRKHMRPELGQVALQAQDQEGIDINTGYYAKTIMQFGEPKDLGLLLSAAMYSIYKRGDISDWAEFIEIFGRGIVDAQWDGFDEGQRQKLAKAIREMGGGGVIIRPDGTKLDIKNNTGSANGQLQDTFATKMDGYISKALLGTTETTDSSRSSGYAQAETHNKQDEKKNESDLQFVRRSLNSQFIKVLKAAGFDTKGGTFVIKKDKNLDKAAFDIHMSMRKSGIPVDDDFFYEEYGVRKPDNYDELKNTANARIEQEKDSDTPDDSGDKNVRTPKVSDTEKDKSPSGTIPENSKQLSWLRRLIRLFSPAPVVTAGAETATCCGEIHTVNLVSIPGFDTLKFARKAWQNGGHAFIHSDLFDHYASILLAGFEDGWNSGKEIKLAALGFDYDYTDPKIQTAWELNLFKFSAVRAAYQSAEVNALFRKAKNFDEFHRLVKKMYGVKDRNHLRTEWVTANAAGESASTYYRLLGQTKTFPYWKYMTQRDDKVRKGHERLHGCIFRWNDTIWDYIMPPNGWNCRCYIVPMTKEEVTDEMLAKSQEIADEFYNSEAWQEFEKSGFALNMANTKEVFNKSNQYSKTPDKVLDNAGQLYYDDWGLLPIQERQAKASTVYREAHDRSIIDEFWTKHKTSGKAATLLDYKGRSLTFYERTYKAHNRHDSDRYRNRYKYLPALEEVIKSPDEVWINNDRSKRFDTYVYIKYWKNVIVKVVCTLDESGNLTINSWQDVYVNEETFDRKNKLDNDRYRHRRGLLIKK